MSIIWDPILKKLRKKDVSGSSGSVISSVIGGTDITINNTDPLNPVINFSGVYQAPIIVVANYSAILALSPVTGKFYWASSSQGTSWLPGSLGGTFYNSGIYYYNGASLEFLNVPYQATLTEVNTGTNTDKFVTPSTFINASKWSTKQDILVSGTNIKTVNGSTLLGSGNLVVGDALVANTLSQFALTTSAQLRGVLSDENGSGVALFDSSTSATFITPLLGTPTSGILTNCTGYTGANLTLNDVTTNNSSTSNHGFLKKLDNVATDYMDGTGAWSIPQGVQGNLTGVITSVGLVTSLGSFTSAQLLGAITDETGGLKAVFSDAPTFTTNITTPYIIGGTAAGSFIKFNSTTGTGTTVGIAHEFWGGTNGGTNLLNIYNDAQFLINTVTRNPGSLGILRVGQGTSTIDIGQHSAAIGGIWFSQSTPSPTNYALIGSATITNLGATATIQMAIGNSVKMILNTSSVSFTPGIASSGAINTFTFTSPASTGQTASTEINGFNYSLTTNRQWATGAITSQREFLISAPTYRFVGASTINDAATLAISGSPIASTNATITRSMALWVQGGLSRFDGGIVGVVDASSAGSGIVGEVISSTISTYTNYTTTATYQNITSIALTPGDWEITAFGTFNSNTATITAASNAIFVISTTTASATGATEGLNISYIPQATLLGTSKESTGSIIMNVLINSNTTYYLNTQATFTLGNPQFVGTIKARRLR